MTLVLTPIPKPKRKGGRAMTLVNLSKPDPRRVPAARGVSRCLSS